MRRIIVLCFSLLAAVAMSGCSATLPNVSSDYPRADQNSQSSKEQTKLIIFNASSPLLFPTTGKMNVFLNGKGAAQLNIYEYVQLMVPQGKYNVELVHYDLFTFRSNHEIELATPEAYLQVNATITSNEARIVPDFPEDLKKYLKEQR